MVGVSAPVVTLACGFGYLNLLYSSPMLPPPKIQPIQNQDKDKKKVAIIGAGIIGLTTAYFLAQNPKNQVIIVERNSKPY